MSDATYLIWCLVETENTLLPITASPALSIGQLKDLIKEKSAKSNDADAHHLTLWKVRMTMASDSTTTINPPAG
jgi:hypothetical protein